MMTKFVFHKLGLRSLTKEWEIGNMGLRFFSKTDWDRGIWLKIGLGIGIRTSLQDPPL